MHDLAANTNVDEFVEQFVLDKGHDTKPQFAYFAHTEELNVKGHSCAFHFGLTLQAKSLALDQSCLAEKNDFQAEIHRLGLGPQLSQHCENRASEPDLTST